MAQKLIASAYRQDTASVFHIIPKVLFDFLQSAAYQHLLPVRTSSQKHNIQAGKINRICQGKFLHRRLDAPPLQPFFHTLDISPVSV